MEQGNKLASQLDAYNKHTLTQMRVPKISDKTPNPTQITAEQIVADPELYQFGLIKMPVQQLVGQDEVISYKDKRRKEFEESLRRQRFHIGLWIRYAEWEGMVQEFRRARSIFERALDISPYAPSLWMRYVEFEMKHKFLNHSRNIFERACTVLPRVDRFWFKYIYMEEILANYAQARGIFIKWMQWNPIAEAWVAFASFETRMGDPDRARAIMYEFLDKNPKIENYIRVGKYEEKIGKLKNARLVCERALKEIGEEAVNEDFFVYWITIEERAKEIERAGQLFDFAFKKLAPENATKLKSEFIKFQSKYGREKDVNKIVMDKRRTLYQKRLQENPKSYDDWINLAMLEQDCDNCEELREIYQKAENEIPSVIEKGNWKSFVSLFIMHAIFEETRMNNFEKAVSILEQCIKLVPHKKFSFSKLWIHLANVHIRNQDLKAARSVLGRAIGQHGSKTIFDFYIDLESKMGNFDRCRKIFEKVIELHPNSADSWINFFKLEADIGEVDRAKSIIRKSLELGFVDHPELLWKAAIDYEIENNNVSEVIELYQLLLQRTKHFQVFISLALYYLSQGMISKMRDTFSQAEAYYKEERSNEDRAIILNNWYECELQINQSEYIEKIYSRLPTKVKKQRVITNPDNPADNDYQYEEYIEYVFNDEPKVKPLSGLQNKAKLWKKEDKSSDVS